MSKLLVAVGAFAAFFAVSAASTPADAQRFSYRCLGTNHTFEGCLRQVGRTVRGEPIRVRPPARRPFLWFLIRRG